MPGKMECDESADSSSRPSKRQKKLTPEEISCKMQAGGPVTPVLASLPARRQYGGATPVQPFATHMQIVRFAFSPFADARIDAALGENARPVSDFHFAIISKGRAANVVSLLRLFQGTGADVTWCALDLRPKSQTHAAADG